MVVQQLPKQQVALLDNLQTPFLTRYPMVLCGRDKRKANSSIYSSIQTTGLMSVLFYAQTKPSIRQNSCLCLTSVYEGKLFI